MIYRFDDFEISSDSLDLKADGVLVHAEPQVLALLALLVENHGRLVGKDELNEKIWAGRFVSESALSSRIKSARQLIGDDGREQKFIRTVHKKGFRFIAEVSTFDESTESTGAKPTQASTHSTDKLEKPTIAVMPFSNLSSDVEQVYFTDGISSDIINHLSKHRWLQVAARNISFGFRDQEIDVVELGKRLGLDYLVAGSVQKSGQRVRINVSLADAKTGHQLWSDRYDREISDIFAVQDEITEKIVARLEPEIGVSERHKVVASTQPDIQAWEAYHLGIYHFFRFTGEDNVKAQNYLKQSQKLDPYFGEAFAWWAYALTLGMVYWGTEPSQEQLDKALEATNKAVQLDSRNASFYALRARVLLARKEYQFAIRENEKAISLNPTFAAAHCGLGDSLAYEGKYEDSIKCFEKAIELSPNDPQIWAFYTYGALAMIFMGEYQRAAQWTEKALSIPNCQYWANAHQMVAYALLDNESACMAAKTSLLVANPHFSIEFAGDKLFYLKKQDQKDLYLKGLSKAGIE